LTGLEPGHLHEAFMNKEVMFGLFRHLLTILGGIFVAKGQIQADDMNTIIGAVSSLAGVGLSIKSKM
jgi:hypothetical protein